MLSRLVMAAVAGVVAYLICVFVGGLLAAMGIPIAAFIGGFLVQYAVVVSVLVAIAYFFGGLSIPILNR